MRHRLRMLLVIVALATSESLGLTFNLNNELVFLDYTWKDGTKRTYEDQFGEYQPDMSHGECGHWAMRALCHGCPELFDLLREWGRDNPQCNVRRATYNDGLPESARAVDLGLPPICWTLS